METWRDAMDKDGLPELPDQDDLHEGPDGHENAKEGIKGKGRAFDKFCRQTSKASQQQPREEHQRNGHLIAVKLGQKLSNGNKLNSDGRYPCSYDGPYDEALNIYHLSSIPSVQNNPCAPYDYPPY